MRRFASGIDETASLKSLARTEQLKRPTSQLGERLRAFFPCSLVPLAFLAQLGIRDIIHGNHFLLFYPAVLGAAMWGGCLPGLTATFLAGALAWAIAVPQTAQASLASGIELFVFIATGTALTFLLQRQRTVTSPEPPSFLPLDISNLPKLEPDPATVSPTALDEHEASPALVLIIEDDMELNALLRNALEKNFRVETAYDGVEGLEKALSLRPDVILTDLVMPRMTGDQFVTTVRGKSEFDGVPIILITAWADEALRASLLRGGAQDYILKPFYPEEILARVSTLVKVKRVRDRLQKELESQITDVETLTSQLAKRTQGLARALMFRDEMLSIASHELKTPLTSLQLQLQMTQSQIQTDSGVLPSPQALDRTFSMSLKQVSSLVSLVDELLDVARIQAGRLTLSLERSELAAVLRETTENFAEALKAASCPLELDFEDGIFGLWDRQRLGQVFVNLISNIIKYAPGGPARITTRKTSSHALITIEDHGPGIAPESQTKIFDRFERCHSGSNAHGLGLGLYIAKRIVEAHHGSIGLESVLGEGAKFLISLPLNPHDFERA